MGVVSNLENSNMAMLSCGVTDGHVKQQPPTQWTFAASDANGRLLKCDKSEIDNTKYKKYTNISVLLFAVVASEVEWLVANADYGHLYGYRSSAILESCQRRIRKMRKIANLPPNLGRTSRFAPVVH